jgi:hypothetical protein
MPAGKKKAVAPPIDRPLAKAYLRQFSGWSTAYPPGQSEPSSCRVMENVMVLRNEGLAVRPGLRYTSYEETPDMDPDTNGVAGVAFDKPLVGVFEPFYLNTGEKALLFAVREDDDTVGFRALHFAQPDKTVYALTDPLIGFYIPQGVTTLNFSAATKHVTYLQIDNKVLALSDAGESPRMFTVGAMKIAKRLNTVPVPEWDDGHKPTLKQPGYAWVAKLAYTVRRNECINPSFEAGYSYWDKSDRCDWEFTRTTSYTTAPGASLILRSKPSRTNLAQSPLHNVSNDGPNGWYIGHSIPELNISGDYMKIYDPKGTGLFLSHSAKLPGIEPGKKYKLAFTYDCSDDVDVKARLVFFRNNGSEIGEPTKFNPADKHQRFVSVAVEAPQDAASVRIHIGGDSAKKKPSWVKVKNVVLCRANESTDMFHGGSGTDYHWEGTENFSASVYHPATDITIESAVVPAIPYKDIDTSIYARVMTGADKTVEVKGIGYSRDRAELVSVTYTGTLAVPQSGNWLRFGGGNENFRNYACVGAKLTVTIKSVARGESYAVDAALIECGGVVSTNDRPYSWPTLEGAHNPGTYFDGSSTNTASIVHSWENRNAPHQSASIQVTTIDPTAIPTVWATPTTKTLVAAAATPDVNTYKIGCFYTFENEIGESAPSKVTEVRVQRPQSNWKWETANNNSEPSGTETATADLCADQLVAVIPEKVYNDAIAAGATRWNLYTFNWSDQDPVPVEGQLADSRELYPDDHAKLTSTALPYVKGGWINITPSRKLSLDSAVLPTKDNRVNYSRPPRARNGVVAGDRIVLVGDADDPGAIRWTTNRSGEYTKFTAGKGGGVKTLSSGNLHLPGSVVLWQNPQSVDTLTILCIGSDGTSICYYMSPASVAGQSQNSEVMGFEETTNTPGSMAPYGVVVHNNALFRPIDRSLLKSTAQNYNINHKSMSDNIANMWEGLQSKNWIMSAVLDNRLYYLVNNPRGIPVEDNCHGNEIWVYDMGTGEKGTWSRFLIQASGLRVMEYGDRVYMGVVRPDGLYYLDPDAREDDYVLGDGTVGQRPIPWYFETNTQGASRAHDAWAHLQQVSPTFGDYEGAVRYGIRGRTAHGMNIDISKQFEDPTPNRQQGLAWDVEDHLLVRRDLKEWYFYAGSVDGKPGSGTINFVAYKFTPVTVNIGYEWGSTETLEYGRNETDGEDLYSTNGIPRPVQDMPWERT